MTTDTLTSTPVATADAAERPAWLRGTAWPTIRRWAVALWRYLLTLYVIARLGLVWVRFTGAAGLADRRTQIDPDTGRMRTRTYKVPRLSRVQIGPHGATMRVRLSPGQDLDTYTAACAALRHAARCQAASAAEIDHQPGYLQLRLLRRDPLHRVLEVPREISPGVLHIGLLEDGRPWPIDFTAEPHYLVSGATGSGKSAIQAAILRALAPTPAVIVMADLKFGVEAQPWRPRLTAVATTHGQVVAWCQALLDHAERRANLFKRLPDVGNINEATALGVHLRRVFFVIDEVAEIALQGDKNGTGVNELLRVAQLVRSMGIHVILAGQRFGSDLGKGITSVRAQIGGRVCARVNDTETARMVLSNLDDDAQRRALTIPRPGQAIEQTGAEWHYARATYLSSAERRAVATRHADQTTAWPDLAADDDQAAAAVFGPAPIPATTTRLDQER
jgi:S-DNA-T family DNA segregation ATPase FtsK/SpoIIIE